jgi:hypothetical protein
MEVTYFRPQRPGPEIALQQAVAASISNILPSEGRPTWTASSIPIGAGMPDLVIVSYRPEVVALAKLEMASSEILAYLRVVTRAKLNTIVERVSQPRTTIVRCIDGLLDMNAIVLGSDTFSLNSMWRSILPEIVTIEAKVRNWKKAVAQAGRNQIFAHRSFIALPDCAADRVRAEPIVRRLGIGILGVGESGEVRLRRRARRTQPKVWTYYYKLASFAAAARADTEGNAVYRSN